MILLLGDLHGHFAAVNAQAAHAAAASGEAVAAVIALGDFGLFAADLDDYFRRRGERFLRPTFFLEGNHEDFSRFAELTAAYADCFTHLPRGTAHTVDGVRLLALGGAQFIDPRRTPAASVIREADIDRALAQPAESIDLIVSHDCPRGAGLLAADGAPAGFARGDELAARYRPRHWCFAHHHCWYTRQRDDITYHGLAEAWEGYAVLGDDGTLVQHVHPLGGLPRPSWFARLRSLIRCARA